MTISNDRGKERPNYLKAVEEITDQQNLFEERSKDVEILDWEEFLNPKLTAEEKETEAWRSWNSGGPSGCEELSQAIYIYPPKHLIGSLQDSEDEAESVYPGDGFEGTLEILERRDFRLNLARKHVCHAIKNGDCSLWGLPKNEPGHEYRPVSSRDVYRVTIGWEDNTISGLGHDLVYCKICERGVTPADEYSPSISRTATKVTSIRQCKKWLLDLMNAGEKEHPKPWYRSEAKGLFKIGDKNFNLVWKQAIQETGNESWSKGGRPKKTMSKETRSAIESDPLF